MSRAFRDSLHLEQATAARTLFAFELLDAVTLARVTDGRQGRRRRACTAAVVNSGGLFVWLE